MPIPTGFDNTVRLVTGAPVGASEINSELATQNGAGYWMTALTFIDANTASLLFVKVDTTYVDAQPQKVNAVSANQSAADTDKAAETPDGYWPTGVFATPGGSFLILYQQIDPPPA